MCRHHIQFVLLFLMCACVGMSQAIEFAGGTGEWDNPYQIATAEQLIAIGSDWKLLDKHYVLIADIDLDPNLSGEYGFSESPIMGTFTGVLDGQGHRIRHLTIRDLTAHDDVECSLFQSIGSPGEVRRLILEDADIVSSSSNGEVGALCASNSGVVFRCSVIGILGSDHRSGGLVAINSGLVEECYSICAASGKVCGGLVGSNSGYVQDCCASGRVVEVAADSVKVAGLVGGNYGKIIRCYANCEIESPSGSAGGLVWDKEHPMQRGSVEDSYFLASSGEDCSDCLGSPLTAEEMTEEASFAGWDFWEASADDSPGSWYMPESGAPELVWRAMAAVFRSKGSPVVQACELLEAEGIKVKGVIYDYDHSTLYGTLITARPCLGEPLGTAVELISSLGPYDWETDPGDGTAESTHLILSAGQLDCLAYEPQLWDRHFQLVSDIDLAGRVYARPLIGHVAWGEAMFEGTFDGNGHLIRNLTIEGCGDSEIGSRILGLFGEIGISGVVKDLGLTRVSARGRGGRGGVGAMLCAANSGCIERCFCVGVVGSHGDIGGFVGENRGWIEDCHVHGRVRKILGVGGFWAGFVSWNYLGTIRTCYATCSVPGDWGDGFINTNEDGSVEYCLWDVSTSGTSSSDGGTGLSTAELMSADALEDLGWAGNPNWVIDDGSDYPRLVWEETSGSSFTAIENF